VERSIELEDLTRALYSAVSTADGAFFERRLSRGASCVVIGTAPGEWWDEYHGALDSIKHQMESVGDAAAIVAGDLRAYQHGGVGWVADRPTFRLGGVDVECRHTSVFVREGTEWRVVQHHFSIAVPNEQAFGEAATRFG